MASIESNIALIGDKELSAKLLRLNDMAVKKIMSPAIRRGLVVVKRVAKQKATPGNILSNEASGLMKKAIKASARSKKHGIVGKIFIDPKVSGTVKGEKHVPAKIAHLVEFGHGGSNPAPPHPFMRPALDETQSEVRQKITDEAKKRLPLVTKGMTRGGKI